MKLSRRNLLKGLGGVAVALPMLEAFGEADLFAQSGTRPKRFVLMYAGVSTGTDASGGTLTMTPTATGRDYPLTRALSPLGEAATTWGAPGQGVQGDVSLVTGLTIPWADSVGATPPPGGRSREFHYNTVGPQISGVRGNAERTGAAQGPSADQIAADVISADRTHRSLSYRVQAARYVGDNSINGGQISYRLDDAGRLRGVEAAQGRDVDQVLAQRALEAQHVVDDVARAVREQLDPAGVPVDDPGGELVARGVGHHPRVGLVADAQPVLGEQR